MGDEPLRPPPGLGGRRGRGRGRARGRGGRGPGAGDGRQVALPQAVLCWSFVREDSGSAFEKHLLGACVLERCDAADANHCMQHCDLWRASQHPAGLDGSYVSWHLQSVLRLDAPVALGRADFVGGSAQVFSAMTAACWERSL